MTFEQAMTRLDEIIARLSDGSATLDESLSLYAEGAALLEQSKKQLDEANLRMETLIEQKEGAPK